MPPTVGVTPTVWIGPLCSPSQRSQPKTPTRSTRLHSLFRNVIVDSRSREPGPAGVNPGAHVLPCRPEDISRFLATFPSATLCSPHGTDELQRP